jgi:two-component system OmpR family response regulator
MRLLIVEDDASMQRILERGLGPGEEGHEVVLAKDGAEGLARLLAGGFDACVLDLLLPELDGFSVLEKARQGGVTTPILILTAKDAVPDRVEGLRRGADDYLGKPFAFAELVARLEALTRRARPTPETLTAGELSVDVAARRASLSGQELPLSEKQFSLLAFLMRHAGRVVTRAMVLDEVFGYSFDPGTNIVDVHIGHLRQKIDGGGGASRITTVRGVGYRLESA